MESRKIACILAAGFIGLGLTASATGAFAKSPKGDVVVEARRIDPETQRVVRYDDLNLAFRSDQKKLNGRIWHTASRLCYALNGDLNHMGCTGDAINSTDEQVAAAIQRAKLRMAGLPVGPAVAISMVIGAR
ncbi:UrcA family protein [Sphingomonas sp. BN140010]|uniref:UrcA family protein n=1 Tax=Sphingomonas arvum TaxID=2992113 RepID=A0ABT3JDX5_9SPHN|nr:UrcA family protein [Sphingomonas sp. BN140010]MCW3797271.1 UrcA family protein [Sphingomonas sp. BN140010]